MEIKHEADSENSAKNIVNLADLTLGRQIIADFSADLRNFLQDHDCNDAILSEHVLNIYDLADKYSQADLIFTDDELNNKLTNIKIKLREAHFIFGNVFNCQGIERRVTFERCGSNENGNAESANDICTDLHSSFVELLKSMRVALPQAFDKL